MFKILESLDNFYFYVYFFFVILTDTIQTYFMILYLHTAEINPFAFDLVIYYPAWWFILKGIQIIAIVIVFEILRFLYIPLKIQGILLVFTAFILSLPIINNFYILLITITGV